MAFDSQVFANTHENYSMSFNISLAFTQTNDHDPQIYWDPMNRQIVKIEEHPNDFDLVPWVIYQGNMYMQQRGERYVVTKDLECVNKWRQLAIVYHSLR